LFKNLPMPYDIKLDAKNAVEMDVVYTVIPSPSRLALTPEEPAKIVEFGSIQEYQKSINEKTSKPSGSITASVSRRSRIRQQRPANSLPCKMNLKDVFASLIKSLPPAPAGLLSRP
jgi:hypothetical protein